MRVQAALHCGPVMPMGLALHALQRRNVVRVARLCGGWRWGEMGVRVGKRCENAKDCSSERGRESVETTGLGALVARDGRNRNTASLHQLM